MVDQSDCKNLFCKGLSYGYLKTVGLACVQMNTDTQWSSPSAQSTLLVQTSAKVPGICYNNATTPPEIARDTNEIERGWVWTRNLSRGLSSLPTKVTRTVHKVPRVDSRDADSAGHPSGHVCFLSGRKIADSKDKNNLMVEEQQFVEELGLYECACVCLHWF